MKKILIAAAVVVLAAFAVPALAATNPFMDVPASHWAYDAVAQLAARGVVSGYPEGLFKGPQPATRYEIASIIARSLAYVDLDKASKQDVEMMRRLVVEFSDELSALGVRVDELDSRVAVLERDLGGWSISGQFRFDWKIVKNEEGSIYGTHGKTDFDLNQYRIWLRRRIDEKVSFTARLAAPSANGQRHANGDPAVVWDYYFITARLGWDITMNAGRLNFDWEADQGFVEPGYWDSWFGDIDLQAFHFTRDWGIANLQLVVGRMADNQGPTNVTDGTDVVAGFGDYEGYLVSALANFNFSEKFRGGAMGYFRWSDYEPFNIPGSLPNNSGKAPGRDDYVVGVYAGFRFHPSVELKGIYYFSGWDEPNPTVEDSGNAWKAILDVNQDLLKFTSLWLEYGQIDNSLWTNTMNSVGHTDADAYHGGIPVWSRGFPGSNDGTTKVFIVNAQQRWNDKWSTYLRFANLDFDGPADDKSSEWTVGARYQYTDALSFELSYDNVSWDDVPGAEDSDHLIRFRTLVAF